MEAKNVTAEEPVARAGSTKVFRKLAVKLSQTPDDGLNAKRIGRQGLGDLWIFMALTMVVAISPDRFGPAGIF
ncbi:hypothetical protein VMCG_09663 [Cytospora schulzeri]|uniref:Uncharacterized protein n=1 Tax=Cytospora schulzeri TaxID=448051 RepID=A0A423VKC3_9PEZI|nr:hypothetical protein VMCG_09663 [Valsa malicola]